MTVSSAGDSPPSPRASPASNSTWPASSDLRVASISLLRATSRTSAFATASVEASELTKTWMPSLPENADVHRRRIDADQRNTALAGARQHIGAAGEAHERLAVAHIDVELGRLRQG